MNIYMLGTSCIVLLCKHQDAPGMHTLTRTMHITFLLSLQSPAAAHAASSQSSHTAATSACCPVLWAAPLWENAFVQPAPPRQQCSASPPSAVQEDACIIAHSLSASSCRNVCSDAYTPPENDTVCLPVRHLTLMAVPLQHLQSKATIRYSSSPSLEDLGLDRLEV